MLRYGFFYGPGHRRTRRTAHCAREVRQAAASRSSGRGAGVFSFIHVDDAAAATVAAVERGAPGIYNVVDDDPAPLREWLPGYAEALGREEAARAAEVHRRGWRPAPYATTHGDRAARRLQRAREGASSAGSRAMRAGAQGFREALG